MSILNNKFDVLVSVIIPIYNVEAFLEECIESVINQSYKNIEILLVDDGSTDKSSDICDLYANKDKRVKVIHKKNGGVSDARNVGFANCVGRYVYFLDGDDYIENNAIENLLEFAINKDLEIVLFDAKIINENGEVSDSTRYIRKKQNGEVYDGIELFNKLIKDKEFNPCVPMMFFLRKAIIYTFENIIHEDELFTIKTYFACSRIAYYNASYYYRRIRNNSIMTTYSALHYCGYISVICGLDDYVKSKDELSNYIVQLYRGAVDVYSVLLLEEKKKIINERRNIKKEFRKKRYYNNILLFFLTEFECLYCFVVKIYRFLKNNKIFI